MSINGMKISLDCPFKGKFFLSRELMKLFYCRHMITFAEGVRLYYLCCSGHSGVSKVMQSSQKDKQNVMFVTMPVPRINAQMATPSCRLFTTCREKINSEKFHKIFTYVYTGKYMMNADFLY
jgi:hypothetical protein